MRNKLYFFLVTFLMLNNLHAQINQELAQKYFKEANDLCIKDNGKLWGVSICGPMVIYDIASKTIATSEPEPNEKRPRILGVVNAPMQWGGKTWGAYIWHDVATKTPRDRKELLLHELFHGVQQQLGLGVGTGTPEHLDEAQGRYWMRLEWRALALVGISPKVATRSVFKLTPFFALNCPPYFGAKWPFLGQEPLFQL